MFLEFRVVRVCLISKSLCSASIIHWYPSIQRFVTSDRMDVGLTILYVAVWPIHLTQRPWSQTLKLLLWSGTYVWIGKIWKFLVKFWTQVVAGEYIQRLCEVPQDPMKQHFDIKDFKTNKWLYRPWKPFINVFAFQHFIISTFFGQDLTPRRTWTTTILPKAQLFGKVWRFWRFVCSALRYCLCQKFAPYVFIIFPSDVFDSPDIIPDMFHESNEHCFGAETCRPSSFQIWHLPHKVALPNMSDVPAMPFVLTETIAPLLTTLSPNASISNISAAAAAAESAANAATAAAATAAAAAAAAGVAAMTPAPEVTPMKPVTTMPLVTPEPTTAVAAPVATPAPVVAVAAPTITRIRGARATNWGKVQQKWVFWHQTNVAKPQKHRKVFIKKQKMLHAVSSPGEWPNGTQWESILSAVIRSTSMTHPWKIHDVSPLDIGWYRVIYHHGYHPCLKPCRTDFLQGCALVSTWFVSFVQHFCEASLIHASTKLGKLVILVISTRFDNNDIDIMIFAILCIRHRYLCRGLNLNRCPHVM